MIEDIEGFLGREPDGQPFVRQVHLDQEEVGFIRMWRPQVAPNGSWVCIIQLSWLHRGAYSIAPGEDELDAILSALMMIRSFIDHGGREAFFARRPHGGIPLLVNRMLSDPSAKAIEDFVAELHKVELGI